jgi:hypothetical protein
MATVARGSRRERGTRGLRLARPSLSRLRNELMNVAKSMIPAKARCFASPRRPEHNHARPQSTMKHQHPDRFRVGF